MGLKPYPTLITVLKAVCAIHNLNSTMQTTTDNLTWKHRGNKVMESWINSLQQEKNYIVLKLKELFGKKSKLCKARGRE